MVNNNRIRRVVVIAVNARTVSELNHDRSPATPWVVPVIANVAGTPMANYSFDTISMTQELFSRMNAETDSAMRRGVDTPDVHYHFIEVAFNVLPEKEQAHFNAMGTNYSLSKQNVADLIAVAKKILGESKVYQNVVQQLQ